MIESVRAKTQSEPRVIMSRPMMPSDSKRRIPCQAHAVLVGDRPACLLLPDGAPSRNQGTLFWGTGSALSSGAEPPTDVHGDLTFAKASAAIDLSEEFIDPLHWFVGDQRDHDAPQRGRLNSLADQSRAYGLATQPTCVGQVTRTPSPPHKFEAQLVIAHVDAIVRIAIGIFIVVHVTKSASPNQS